MKRIDALRRQMRDKELEAVLVQKPENRYYLSGFTGTTGSVLITLEDQFFLTDFRYVAQAKSQCPGYTIIQISQAEPIYHHINQHVSGKLGFEDDFFTVEQYGLYRSKLEAEMIPLKRLIEDLRVIKDDTEIELIHKAQQIADQAFDHILGFIEPGVTELEVADELIRVMKLLGASGESFQIIVASGVRGAMPHGVASDKKIEAGELVTMDFGCMYRGYASDMTRTVAVGEVSEELKAIYQTVLKAQETALAAIKPGLTGQELDTIARDIITEAGYGDHFGHGLGHGVGLEIHERPGINQIGTEKLQPGMIITDEPGIYIDDVGGVRIEDLILVTQDGYEVLSTSPKELIVLPT